MPVQERRRPLRSGALDEATPSRRRRRRARPATAPATRRRRLARPAGADACRVGRGRRRHGRYDVVLVREALPHRGALARAARGVVHAAARRGVGPEDAAGLERRLLVRTLLLSGHSSAPPSGADLIEPSIRAGDHPSALVAALPLSLAALEQVVAVAPVAEPDELAGRTLRQVGVDAEPTADP